MYNRTLVLILSLVAILLIGAGAKFNIIPTITGLVTGTASVTVATTVSISLPTSTAAFGSLQTLQTSNTTDLDPFPIVIRNDGNVNVNLTVNASSLWTSVTTTSSYFQFNVTENETGSVVSNGVDLRQGTFINMTIGATPEFLANRTKFAAANDELRLHLNVTVPEDEAAGAVTSTIDIRASQS